MRGSGSGAAAAGAAADPGTGGVARSDRQTRLRRALSGLILFVAAFGSLATSDDWCPRAVSLPDTVEVQPSNSITRRYRVDSSTTPRLHVLVRGTSTGAADVRVRLEPDDPSLFHPDFPPTDAGAARSIELALRPGTQTSAELELPSCKARCEVFGFSVTVDHLAGEVAALNWDVVIETENCDDNYHALIERQ